jgi:DNA-binding NtrC family response regulator
MEYPGIELGRKKKAGTTPARERLLLKRELDNLVAHMQASGITYAEGVREFKKRFLLEVLARHRGNQCKAAAELGMHRNTLSRTIAELEIDPAQIRSGLKRPVRSERPVFETKQMAR